MERTTISLRTILMLWALVSIAFLVTGCARVLEAQRARAYPMLGALGPVPEPPDNLNTPEKVELGRYLFFDVRLSGDGAVSCASCHSPEGGWGDYGAFMGYPATRHWRNSQTVVNTGYLSKLFWAGEKLSLEAQAHSAITGNLAGNGDTIMIEERLRQVPGYGELFAAAFGAEQPTYELALKAISAFERTIVDNNTPFDRYMRGERGVLSAQAERGLELFTGKAGCVQCHNGALLSDESFHNVGTPRNSVFEDSPLHQIALRYQHYARGVPEEVYRTADRDLGLYYTTKRAEDIGKFRTPPLRHITHTAPYMHNGAIETLEEVVDFYDAGGGDDPNKSELLQPLGLSAAEKQDLLAFLASLSGEQVAMERPVPLPYAVMEQ